ncbi:MAG TPA: PsiF family protein [Steroidobacteraceae bacterium]|nr:PsiF family protein [Steroidobacteraceae bacterium]
MRLISALAAIAIAASGAAAAADPPATPSANPVPSLKVCNKKADAKKLTGPARAQFVKDCRAGKSSS